ncbi:CD3337/EF1877 family mobilome membrane protein [Enterococcus sp. DIV0187]|uniref:CD3337/EF1877 family mobilome membrane protein n=1 Tax=Enterococcus sp. DIV0187 TaxID=2774644 RepID=UPI003F20B871
MIKILLGIVSVFFLLSVISITAQATGLIDETINSNNNYSKYPVDNYSLDYFVDSKWDWLPWNWGDGIGKSVMYGIYSITNLIWLISVYLSNAAGYLVGEAYSLDFISETTEAIGRNIQTLAGINQRGFMSTGFYPGFLLLLIVIMGIYVTYTGLIKRQTSKAFGALFSFITIFTLSSAFIAYSPNYISRINDFSSDISGAALSIGSKMTMPNSESRGKSSVDAIRDSLFEIQVKQPWMILQYGDSDITNVGKERVESLESTSPFANKGKDRIEIVKEEINKKENDNMTITKTINRLGVAVFIFIFNIMISVFVFILTGIMIFSQVLFIVFAVFLPISFLLSMIPSFSHLMKTTIMRLFNVIMMRAGITLVLTISFSLSAMIYGLTASQPFFVVAFMQIVVFAGIYFKLNDLMGMMALNSSDSQSTGSRVIRRPKQSVSRAIRKMAIGSFALRGLGFSRKEKAASNKTEANKTQKRPEGKETTLSRNGEESKRKTLSNSRIQESEERAMNQQKKQTEKKAIPNKDSKEKTIQDVTRKFKQSKYKPKESMPLTKQAEPVSEKTRDSKRRNSPTRSLDNPNRKAMNQSTSDRQTTKGEDSKKGNQTHKYGKQNSVKTLPMNQNNRVTRPSEMKKLESGQSIKREVIQKNENQIVRKTNASVEKNRRVTGKGAKRR